jgi:hypothetical protein
MRAAGTIRVVAVAVLTLVGCSKQEPAKPIAAAPVAPAVPAVAPAAAPMEKIEVEKAPGPDGKRIAELFASRKELAAKPVAVRGKVVKYAPGILGGNWAHLRDGTGADASKDNDLTVKTQDTVAVGDTVVAKGTVVIDRDLGAGYFYPVLIEDAKIEK